MSEICAVMQGVDLLVRNRAKNEFLPFVTLLCTVGVPVYMELITGFAPSKEFAYWKLPKHVFK
jgi:hypothetical protein